MRVNLLLRGERVEAASVETGLCHRGVEKLFERRSWRQSVLLAERIDPFSPVHHALACALALENLAGHTASKRAATLRVTACELERIASHINFLGKLAFAIGYENLLSVSRRDREVAAELFSGLCGSRAAFGLVRHFEEGPDPNDEILNRANEYVDYIELRIPEYYALTVFNPSLRSGAQGIGELELQSALRFSLSGPNLRASASTQDIRKTAPYCGYGDYEFRVPAQDGGSALERILVRLEEMTQSCSILRACLERLEFPQKYGLEKVETEGTPSTLPSGEAFITVEAPRGRLSCYVKSDGGRQPARVKFTPPSLFAIGALPFLLKDTPAVFDAALIIASLDISPAEVDR